jgi:hypothetical protein
MYAYTGGEEAQISKMANFRNIVCRHYGSLTLTPYCPVPDSPTPREGGGGEGY